MGERRRLAEVPLPAALAGKGLGEVGQVRGFVRGDHFGLYALAIMVEKGLANRIADLLMGDARQQFREVRHASAYGGDPFRLQLFLVRIEVVCQTAQVGIQQQRTVVEAAIFGLAIGRAGDFAIAFGGLHHQIVAPGGLGRNAERIQGIKHNRGGDGFIVLRFAGHKGKAGIAEIVEHRAAAAAATRQAHVVLFHAPGVTLLPGVLRTANDHRIGIAP